MENDQEYASKERRAFDAAFAIMTGPDTTCSSTEAIYCWESGENHPGCVLWKPFEYMDCETLLETYDMLVQSHLKILKDCQEA